MFRYLMLACLLLLVPACAFAENHTLSGQIVVQNSSGEPLAGVQVAAKGASPATSDSTGQFELKFADRKEGDRVFLTLKKEGFEVVNRKELEQVIRADENDIVIIVMCKAGERDRHAMRYYDIAEKSILAAYETELRRIKDDHEKTLKEKNAELEKLKVQRDAALAQAKELSEKFAQVNLDEASEMYKQAFGLFQSGKVEEARKVLDDAKMDQALAAAKKLEEEAKKAIRQTIENYMLKAQLCIIGFQFAEAEKNFHKAVDADPENLENTFELAMYLQKQNQHLKAVPLYEKVLELAERQKDEEKIAAVLNNLGVLYKAINDYTASESAFNQSLEVRKKLAKNNPDIYLPDVAMTQNNLGNFYVAKNDYAAAEKAYLQALEIREKLAQSNPDTYLPDLAMTQNNLDVLYSDKNDYASAEKAYLRALEIYEKLALSNPDTYLPYVAIAQNNLGILYKNKNEYAAAEKSYLRALEIREKLTISNPDTYLPDMAGTLANLSIFHKERVADDPKEFHKEKGLEYAKRVIEISSKFPHVPIVQKCRKIAEKVKYELETVSVEDLQTRRQAETFANRAIEMEQDKSQAAEALDNYRKAAELYEKSIAKERDFKTLLSLTDIYAGIARLEKDVKTQILYQEKIIAIQEEILQMVPDENADLKQQVKQKLAGNYGNISWNFLFDRQFAKAGEAAQKGIALDPAQEWIKTNLASSFLFTGQWDKAKAIYLELKDKTYNDKKFREIFLEDLNELEKAGITHPDTAKVREVLKEP